MSLKKALLGSIVRTTIRTIVAHREIQDSKITTQNKNKEISPAYEYMLRSSKKCFILESAAFDMCSLKEYCGQKKLKYDDYFGIYKIFDKNEKLQFLSLKKRPGTGKKLDKIFLFDLHETVLGSIKQHIISPKVPIVEDDTKTCSVILEDNKLCSVKRTYIMGKEHCIISGEYKIEYVKNTDFIIKKNNKKIATIKFFRPTLKQVFPKSIVVEYDNEKQKTIVLLLAMAIDTICLY